MTCEPLPQESENGQTGHPDHHVTLCDSLRLDQTQPTVTDVGHSQLTLSQVRWNKREEVRHKEDERSRCSEHGPYSSLVHSEAGAAHTLPSLNT